MTRTGEFMGWRNIQRLGVGPESASGADRVPRGLELKEVADRVDALRLVGQPLALACRLRTAHALHALRRPEPQRLPVVAAHGCADRAEVRMRGKRRHQLLAKTGEDVD